jgi:GNAT superfamily N-acetyltransferase
MTDFIVKDGYVPGVIGRVVQLHALYYFKNWGFGSFFEAKVASEMAAFVTRYDHTRDGLWAATVGDEIEGALVIDGMEAEEKGAHLRWFIVSDKLRGKGAGKALVDTAMQFCRKKKHPKVYLWTFEGLGAARHLYEKAGFQLVEQKSGRQWGKTVNEQRFEAILS